MRSILLIIFITLASIAGCLFPEQPPSEMFAECEQAYPISGMYFDKSAGLIFKLRLVKVVEDTSGTVTPLDSVRAIKGVAIANEIYAKGNISFEYDSIELLVDSAYGGAMRDMHLISRRYNKRGYINIYIFEKYPGTKSFGASGGAPSLYAGTKDKYLATSTLAHEIGHCLGLHHTHSFDSSQDGYTVYTGDLVCDTPKNTIQSSEISEDCEYEGNQDLTEKEAQILVCNIMSYSHLDCRSCITEGQIQRIRFIVDQSMDLKGTVSGLPDMHEILF